MASSFPDIWTWIQTIPPLSKWDTNSNSISIYSSSNSTQASLKFSITKATQNPKNPSITFSIFIDYHFPISLWTSKTFKPKSSHTLLDEDTICALFYNFISGVLSYGPTKSTTFLHIPPIHTIVHFKDIFNLSFFVFTLLICIYESPHDLRSEYLNALEGYLISSYTKDTTKKLMMLLGSNVEEQWMRSFNLGLTNWIVELKAPKSSVRRIIPLFSYAFSAVELCKVHLYCPIIAMDGENSNESSPDERLKLSLRYHQLEGVIQFICKAVSQEKWIDVIVKTDNIRCDIIRLVSENLMRKRGTGSVEKHFPSRISLQLTPAFQTNVISVSVSKSSENPTHDIGTGYTIDAGFNAPTSLGLNVTASETSTISLKPWKFEQSVYGYTANLNWYLHDSVDGREVASTRPSKLAMCWPQSWFKDRYSKATRPFTRQGGVVFARDEYGDNVVWKVNKAEVGKSMEWEIKGWIWLTYWPNKHRTFHNETRRFEFKETFNISLD